MTLNTRVIGKGIIVGALAMLAAACIFAPGKFTSQLDLKKDHSFAFHYAGEIVMIPLMKSESDQTFEPSACHDEQTYDERTCTADELAQQKKDWEESREQKRKSDADMAKMMMGGIDPNNPEAGKEIADKLRRQAGWNKVEYIGDGKFDVDFSASGKLDHDFVFPTFEGFSMSNPFLQVFARADGSVRVDAPGFGPAEGAAASQSMAAGLAGSDNGKGAVGMADGIFTIVTDGEILANNTDEGAAAAPGGKALTWKVNPRIPSAPTALVKLAPFKQKK